MGLPSSLVKVWPSSSPRWRWPSRRWPRTSWKKTAEARPERMAGPLKGSVIGAARRASRFFAMAMVLSVRVFWSGRWAAASASKVSARKRSMPSAARVRATMTRRATWLGVATRGAFGGDEVVGLGGGFERDVVVEDVGVLLEESRRARGGGSPRRCVSTTSGGRTGGRIGLRAVSVEKSAEASSSLARTCCSVLTLRKPSRALP